MRRSRYPNLSCPDTLNYFKLKFSPHASIKRIMLAQVHGESPQRSATLSIYSSPSCQTLFGAGSSEYENHELDPDNIEMNPIIYRVVAPISLTAGNVGEYVANDGLPYVDDEWRIADAVGYIYILLGVSSGGGHWDLLIDSDRN